MPTSVRLPKDIERRFGSLAEKTSRTKAFYIREMILTHSDDLEDYCLAVVVAKRPRTGRRRIFSDPEVRRHLGLAD